MDRCRQRPDGAQDLRADPWLHAITQRQEIRNDGATAWRGAAYEQLLRSPPAATSRTSGLTNPEFTALAKAYGCHGETVTDSGAFAPAFARAAAAGKAAVIELQIDPDVITTRTTLSAIRRAAERSAGRDPLV